MHLVRQRTLTIIADTEHPQIKRLERPKDRDTYIIDGMRKPEYVSFEDAKYALEFFHK